MYISAPRTIEKMKIMGAVLELPVKQHYQSSQPNYLKIGPNWPNWPNWQCCLAGSSKTAPRILFFSIVLCAEYLSHVKSIAIYASVICTNSCYEIFFAFLLWWFFDNIASCNSVPGGLKNLIDKSIDDNASSALYRWIRRKGLLPGVFISAISECVNLRFYISQNERIPRNLIALFIFLDA